MFYRKISVRSTRRGRNDELALRGNVNLTMLTGSMAYVNCVVVLLNHQLNVTHESEVPAKVASVTRTAARVCISQPCSVPGFSVFRYILNLVRTFMDHNPANLLAYSTAK